MTAISVKTIRQRVEAQLVATAGLTKSRFSPELFGFDARLLMHGAFAVGAPFTEANPTTQRQRRTEGVLANSRIEVRLAGNHRADAQIADFDTFLDLEATVITSVEAISRTDLHVVFETATREVSTGFEFLLSTISFRIIHRLALE